MNVQNLLNRIQELGYRFELISNDTLKFSYVKDGDTPKEAIQILRQVKEQKQEVIWFLQQQSKPELQKPIIKRYEPTEDDWALDRYHAQQTTPNPKGYKCIVCGNLGETYRLVNKADRWWFGWLCSICKPDRN